MADAIDAEQVRLAARGDVDAFAQLYERGFRCVWAFAACHCRDRDTAEALTEAVLTRAFSALGSFPCAVSWPAWLGAIAQEIWVWADEDETAHRRVPCGGMVGSWASAFDGVPGDSTVRSAKYHGLIRRGLARVSMPVVRALRGKGT